jgi:heme exporter protein A
MLTVHNISYSINERKLFANISMSLLPSCVLYIKGSNGSGKTTLLRIMAGIIEPSSGQILCNLENIKDIAKPYCTYIGHMSANKSEFTVLDNLKFWTGAYNSNEVLEAAIHYFRLQDILGRKYYELSEGNKKKVALARLLACQSDLWLLDEIDSNLDQENRDLLYNLIISKANNGGIIVISSHQKENAIKTADVLQL